MNTLRVTGLTGFHRSIFFLLLSLGGLPALVLAQKPLELLPINPIGKKVPPTEGYLGILTTPQAVVTLSGKEKRVLRADQNGMAVFEKLSPGIYTYRIILDDYHSLERSIVKVKPGKPEVAVDRLMPVFSTLALVMGGQAGHDVRVWINEKPISADQIEVQEGKLLVKRLQLPERVFHEIRIEKPNHKGIVIQRLIQLGECENFVSVELVPLKGALSLSGNAGARIYLDGQDKGILGSDGRLRLADLLPREYRLRAELFGFANLDTAVTISPGAEESHVEVRLEPVTEITEMTQAFRGEIFPVLPKAWQVDQGKSLRMEGAGLALFKSGTYAQHPFSVYEDSTMIFQVQQWDGGGIGWVARAIDQRNYYKFELLPPSPLDDKARYYQMVFSLCEDGICRPLKNDPLSMFEAAHLREGGFRVTMTVEKDQIWHCIKPRGRTKRPLGPTYAAPAFARGGMGMSGVAGARSTIDELSLFPQTFEQTDCQAVSKPGEIKR